MDLELFYLSNLQRVRIVYASRTLTKAERQYCTSRKEMMALVWGICQFRPYLYGRAFQTARGNKYILDYFTKWKEAYALPDMEAITIARIFINEFIWCLRSLNS